MGTLTKVYNITDASGTTATITKDMYRREVTLRNDVDSDRVWIAINENAVSGFGIYIDPGEGINYAMLKGEADIYLVCSSGETATVYAHIG